MVTNVKMAMLAAPTKSHLWLAGAIFLPSLFLLEHNYAEYHMHLDQQLEKTWIEPSLQDHHATFHDDGPALSKSEPVSAELTTF